MILLMVGGLNWGLVGIFEYDLVATIFGDGSTLARVVYSLVGVAALWSLGRALTMNNKPKVAAAPAQPGM